MKLLGLKKDSDENQGSIFDIKREYEYSDMLKLIWEIIQDKEKLWLAKFVMMYWQVYEMTPKQDLFKHLNMQRSMSVEIENQLWKLKSFLKINQNSTVKETFSELKKIIGLKEKKHIIKLAEKIEPRKQNPNSRQKTFKNHNNSVVGYDGIDLDAHLIQGNQTISTPLNNMLTPQVKSLRKIIPKHKVFKNTIEKPSGSLERSTDRK